MPYILKMSKMPAKKKSCFQITSVTQAQVAASSITDDTESLDDPDESRTEDVSSEILDVSRADFEPEACDISSSEETLNTGVETEINVPHDGLPPTVSGPPNGGSTFGVGSVALSQQGLGVTVHVSQFPATMAGVVLHPVLAGAGGVNILPVSGTQTPSAASLVNSTSTSCSSRFRVIKLDHGTGEPFRRGRWTCMEFYERDSEGSVITRTVDSIRHANTLDHSTDRDSGLGATGGSVAAAPAPKTLSGLGHDSAVSDCAYACSSQLHLEPQPQSYSVVPQTISGPCQGTGYAQVPSRTAVTVQAQGGSQPVVPLSLVTPGTNSVHHNMSLQQVQKSPSMPSGQTQQFGYPTQQQQLLSSHLQLSQPSLAPPGQADYRPQHLHAQTTAVGLPVSQGMTPVMTPATAVAPGIGPTPREGIGHPSPQGIMQLHGSGVEDTGVLSAQQQPSGQYQTLGMPDVAATPLGPHTVLSGNQNMATLGAGSEASTGRPVLNHVPSPVAQSPLSQSWGQQSAVLGSQSLGQGYSVRRKSDTQLQPLAVSGKDLVKPLISEGLALATPAVNSLFELPITVEGEDDGTSGASLVAIDNKIEQAMDLVKSHLMYAVREEVEVLKEQIKELYERNSVLERENAVLKSLANSDQLSQLSLPPSNPTGATPPQQAEAPPPLPNVSSA
ncbi:hypothetical protein GJAV_G00114440 [Gymnothorax javanicus]|nr:hypothetical protein GJAV_G00114440 [Gymnothorax javanicus]